MPEINQGHLTKQIKKYLENRGWGASAEKMALGYCTGFALLFLYYVSKDKEDDFFAKLDHIAAWDEDKKAIEKSKTIQKSDDFTNAYDKIKNSLPKDKNINPSHPRFADYVHEAFSNAQLTQNEKKTLLSSILPDDLIFEKVFNAIEWIQNSYQYISAPIFTDYHQLFEMIRVDEPKHKLFRQSSPKEPLYQASCIIDSKLNLIKFLDRIPDNTLSYLNTFGHAIALAKKNSKYYYYESNSKKRFNAFPSADAYYQSIDHSLFSC